MKADKIRIETVDGKTFYAVHFVTTGGQFIGRMFIPPFMYTAMISAGVGLKMIEQGKNFTEFQII